MSSTVERIKEKLSIVDVISSYIKLDRAGKSFKATCPFHTEKTPSFFVSPDRDSYYCFGCNSGGDVFTFVQEYEGLDFLGALKVLADKAGVPIIHDQNKSSPETLDKEKLYTCIEDATAYFENQLMRTKGALDYIRARGVTEKTQKLFRIGFATSGWHSIEEYLSKKGHRLEAIHIAGLVKKKDDAKGYYDTFRSRILFPVNDQSGRPIAFSGRVFESDDSAKYLNSPETPLFKKSLVLYGFDMAKQSMRTHDFCILVEGAFDLVLSHQAGFTNTVAVMGTALSQEHVNRLKRFTNRMVIALDADNAGVLSAIRSAHIALSAGMDVKIARLPAGMDPADAICADIEKWRKAIREAVPLIDFLLDQVDMEIVERHGSRTVNEQQHARVQAVCKKVLPSLVFITNAIDQEHSIRRIAEHLSVSVESINEEFNKLLGTGHGGQAFSREHSVIQKQEITTQPRHNRLVRQLAGIFLWQQSLSSGESNELSNLKKEFEELIGKSIADCISAEEQTSIIFESEVAYDGSTVLTKHIIEMLSLLKEGILKETFTLKMRELKFAEQHNEHEKVALLLIECNKLSQQLEALKKQ